MKKLHKMMICWEPPVSDSAWMLMAKIAMVPSVEREIVVGIDEIMGWDEFLIEDWPLPVLN